MPVTVYTGEQLTISAPYKVESGDGVLLGAMFGVAVNDADSTEPVDIVLTGVFDLPKTASQAWTVGAAIYWDASGKKCTTVASTNKQIGLAVLATGAGATEEIGRVRLNGSTVKADA